MQEKVGKPEEEKEEDVTKRLAAVEAERDRLRDELQEMKMVAEHANNRLTESMSHGKVADVFSELNSAVEALTISSEDLKIKEKVITALTTEVVTSKESQAKLVDDLGKAKSVEVQSLDQLSRINRRSTELEEEVERLKQSEEKLIQSLMEQTKLLEEAKIQLEETKLESKSFRQRLEKFESEEEEEDEEEEEYGISRSPSEEQLSELRVELEALKESLARAHKAETAATVKNYALTEEAESLRTQLKKALEAETNSMKALDDMAIALKEVVTESKSLREKIIATEGELEHYRREAEESRERLRNAEERQRQRIEEARKEAEQYRNAADRLRLDSEESVMAWNDKEKEFVECIRKAEEEKNAAVEENRRMEEVVAEAEKGEKSAKQETQNLRDILKQALNEATVAKEAAGIAQSENSQLKDVLAEKDDALVFITKENESLRANEAAAQEKIKELKQKLSELSKMEDKGRHTHTHKDKDKEGEKHHKSHDGGGGSAAAPGSEANPAAPKEHQRKLSSAFSFNLRELIIPTRAKETAEEQEKKELHHEEADDFKDAEDFDPLKGSIFDVAESPVAAPPKHQRKKSFSYADPEHEVEEFDHLEGDENNPRKKRALLRRFGDIITRRRGYHRKEPSIGGGLDVVKKESAVGSEGHKKETPLAGEGHRRELSSTLEEF